MAIAPMAKSSQASRVAASHVSIGRMKFSTPIAATGTSHRKARPNRVSILGCSDRMTERMPRRRT